MIIDLHAHTLPRSSCSSIGPEDLIERVKRSGIAGVCLTEHDKVWPEESVAELREKYQFLILRGMEVNTNFGHVLVFGLEAFDRDYWDVRILRQAVDSEGGVMIMAHPLREGYRKIYDAGCSLFFDAIEVLNGTESSQRNDMALALSQQAGLRGIGGSDAHAIGEIGTCATIFEDAIGNELDLIKALKSNRYEPHRIRDK